MYKAIVRFADLTDGGRVYQPGDAFPREGLAVSAERLAELSTPGNRQGRALIAEVDEKPRRARKKVNKNGDAGAGT